MNALPVSAAVVLALAAPLFSPSPGSSPRVPSVSVPATNVLSQKTLAPPPGIYHAKPYSCIVVVPRPVDNGLAHLPASTNRFAIRSVQPPLQLEPRK
ncbi:MAG TPA: hypothetical protein VN829_19070 [Dongiaceae bacterium]|nr:hypothetical protein [Dongiaceae bacterium]